MLHRRRTVQLWLTEEFGRRVYRRQAVTSEGSWSLVTGTPIPSPMTKKGARFDMRTVCTTHAVCTADANALSPWRLSPESVVIHRQSDGAMFTPPRLLEV